MMRELETGKDKIQRICDALKKETLDPARQEAAEIVENAHLMAQEIVSNAKKEAESILDLAKTEREERKQEFETALLLAAKQGIEALKEKIEKELFDPELKHLTLKEMKEPKMIARILDALLQQMEAKGIEEEFIATIPKEIAPRKISELLAKSSLETLGERGIQIGEFQGGVQLSLRERKMTLDVSDEAVRELIADYIRRDFRDLIFNA